MPHRRGHRQRPRPIRQESSDSILPVYIKLKNTRNSKSENETLLKNKFNLHRVSNVNKKGLLPRVDRWYRSSVVNNFDIETILNDPDVETVFIDESITENDGTFEPSLIYSTTNYHYTLNDETGWDSAMVEYGTGDYSPLLLAIGSAAYPFDTDYKDKLILFDPPVHSPIQWINGTSPENYGECWWRNPCLENCPDGGSSYYECLYNDWAQCGDENEKHNMFQCTNWDWGHGHESYHETAVLSVLGANSDTHGSCPNCKLGMVYDKVKDSFFQEPDSEFFIQRAGQSTFRENRLQTFERTVENAIEYGAVVINCSWGDYASSPANQAGNYQARREYWQALVDDAWDNNTLIFVAAGNNEKIGNNDFMCNPNHVWELGDGTTMTANECSQITDEQECLDKSYDHSNEIAYGPCRLQPSGYCTFNNVISGHRFPTCLEKVIQVQGSSGGKSNWGTEEILTDELGIYAISAPMYQFTSTERNDVGLFMTSGNGYDHRAMIVNHPYSYAFGGPTFGLYWTEPSFTSTGEYTIDYTSDGNDQYDNYRLYEEYQNDGTYQTLIEDHFWFLNEEHDDYPAPLVIQKWGISPATSYNTPMVAGVAGLLKSHNPDLTSAQMIEIIFETRNSIDDIPLCDGVENYSWPYQPSPGGGSSCTTTRIPEINVKAAMDYLYENYPPPLTPVNPIPESWNYVVPNMLENVGYTGNDWYTPPETVEGAGCTDPFAINYDPMAVEDDGSCYIPPEYVEGFPIIKYDGFWLIDEVQMMGSVCELLLPGTICSGVSAWVDMDDYPDDEIPINFGGTGVYFYQEWCNQSYLEINPNQADRDYFWVHCEPDENQNQIPDNIDEEISTYQQQYDGLFPFLVFQDYHLYDGNTEMQYYCPAGTVATVIHFSDYIDDYPNGGLTSSYNLDDLTLHNDYGQSMNYYWLACEVSDIPGCTDSSACNYNQDATIDDGNCWYVEGVCDCNGNIPEGVCNCEGDTSEIICGDVNRDCDCVCFNDIDNDNICDEEDLCIEQGGISQECGCNTPIPNGDCDCNGNTLDDCGICGGDGFQVECWNGDLVCDESECNNIPGDANFTGHLSVADVVIILQQIIQSSDIGLTPEEIYQQYPEMDFSGNGRVSVQDIVQMVQYMLYGSEVTVSSAESQQLQEIQRQLDRLGDDSGTTPTQQQTFVSPVGGNNNQITRGGWKPVYGCSDPTATNYNPLANTSDGSCIYEDPYCFLYNDDGECTMLGAQQTTFQSYFFLCLNKNDCYFGCNLTGSAPFDLPQVDENGNYTNWCDSDDWGLFWENEWCCSGDTSPWINNSYWDTEQDLFLYNPLTGETDIPFWEPGDQMFVLDCGDSGNECEVYNPFGTLELWRMGGTVVMDTGGTWNDLNNINDNPDGPSYNQNVGYTPGMGFMVALNLEDGTWNPEFGGTENDGQQMGMRLGALHTIMHWKRSRGLFFRTDRSSLKVSKVYEAAQTYPYIDGGIIYYEDWTTDSGDSPNGTSALGVKIFPVMAEQFNPSAFGPQLVGCMDPEAMNYNPDNEIEPLNSCMYQDEYCSGGLCGCTDTSAMNYDSSAIVDDGSCRYDTTPPPEDCLQCTSDRDCFNQFGYTDTGAMFCNMTYTTPGEIGCCEERNPGTRPPLSLPPPPRPIGGRGNVGRNTQRNKNFRRR